MNRRRLIATLGGLAGAALGPGRSLMGLPDPTGKPGQVPDSCKPQPGAVKLDYSEPKSKARGILALKKSFTKGLTLKPADAKLKIDPVWSTLRASYETTFGAKYSEKLFQGANNALWIVANDHAFILGQLTAYFRKDKEHGEPVQVRDLLRSQVKFYEATSSRFCECYIVTLKAYALPAAAIGATSGSLPTPTTDPCAEAGGAAFGQINEECPFCD